MNSNPAHWHLAINHLPVVGILIITLLLAYGFVRRSNSVVIASYWFFVLLAVLTIITSQTGEKAAHYLTQAGLADRQMIGKHAQAADLAQWSIIVLGVLSLATLFIKKLQPSRLVHGIILLLALVSVGLMSWTSLLGGEIMHKEIRPGFTVTIKDSAKE